MKNTIRYDETQICVFYTHEIYEHVADLFESDCSYFDPEQYYEALYAINDKLEKEILYDKLNDLTLYKINNIINDYMYPIINRGLTHIFLIPNTYEHKLFCEYYNVEKTKQYYVLYFTNTTPSFLNL